MPQFAPLAYKYVAVAAMLAEVNFCSDRLNLPIKHPIEEGELKTELVFQPEGFIGFNGRLDTQEYVFSFGNSSRLRSIKKLHMWNGSSLHEGQRQLSRIKSLIDTNQACKIVRDKLKAIDVDIERLEHDCPVNVERRSFYSEPGGQGELIPLPLFDVDWTDHRDGMQPRDIVRALVAGDSGDLLSLELLDESYSGRPKCLLTNTDALLAIANSEFLAYTREQKSNLLAHSLAVEYPPQKHLTARSVLFYTMEQVPTSLATGQPTNVATNVIVH
jgi:hypothetical protein